MELVRYEAAKHALAEARAVDEVKQLHDAAALMKAYARQAKDKQLEIDAAEIRIRAERRLGEMLIEQKKTVGMNTGGRPQNKPVESDDRFMPTLTEAGITRDLSSQSQAIAKIPEEKFEAFLDKRRDEMEVVTNRAVKQLAGNVHVSNNSGNNEWYTPSDFIESARLVMGCIDTDPASSKLANKTVKAGNFFTVDDDGLSQTWAGNVWMNPPYAQPAMSDFSKAVTDKYLSGEITSACILVNNATETSWFRYMLDACSCVCFPAGRIRFIDTSGNPSGAPLQGQAILYLGDNWLGFADEFAQYGTVLYARPDKQ